MAFCRHCGKPVQGDAAFCTACGKPIQASTDSEENAAAPGRDEVPEPVDDDIPKEGKPPTSPPGEPAMASPIVAQPPSAPPPPPSARPESSDGSGSSRRPVVIAAVATAIVATVGVVAWLGWQQFSADDAPGTALSTTTTAPPQDTAPTTTTSPTTSTTTTSTTTPAPPTTIAADVMAELESTGVFVANGSTADPTSLAQSVANARSHEWALSVIAVPTEPESGSSAYAGSIAGELNAGTVVVVSPDGLGWATRETQFYEGEFERAWSLIPPESSEAAAVQSFVTSVLGGPDSLGTRGSDTSAWLLLLGGAAPTEFVFGDGADLPIMGDWDCDGIETVGLYRPSTADVFLRNSNSAGAPDISYDYNVDTPANHLPLVGDFDGDGCDTVSFYHTTDGRVSIYNTKETSFDEVEGSVQSDTDYAFGDSGDIAFVGDFDGDGMDSVGLFRPSTGMVYLKNSHTGGPADVEFSFGTPGDLPVAGDWGPEDGIDTVALYRPNIETFFFRYTNTAGPADETFEFGLPNGLPVAGAFGLIRTN